MPRTCSSCVIICAAVVMAMQLDMPGRAAAQHAGANWETSGVRIERADAAVQIGDGNEQNNILGMSTLSVVLVSTSVAVTLAAGVSYLVAIGEHASFKEDLQAYTARRNAFDSSLATASSEYDELARLHGQAVRSAGKVDTFKLISFVALGVAAATASGAILNELGRGPGRGPRAALTPLGLIGVF